MKKKYNIDIDTDATGLAGHFASLKSLAGFVVSQLETKPV